MALLKFLRHGWSTVESAVLDLWKDAWGGFRVRHWRRAVDDRAASAVGTGRPHHRQRWPECARVAAHHRWHHQTARPGVCRRRGDHRSYHRPLFLSPGSWSHNCALLSRNEDILSQTCFVNMRRFKIKSENSEFFHEITKRNWDKNILMNFFTTQNSYDDLSCHK